MSLLTRLIRYCIYSYWLRYLGYALKFLLHKTGMLRHLPDKWITLSDYDSDLTIRINPSEHIGQRIYLDGYYEAKEVWILKKLINPGDYTIDVGANIGAWTLLFSKMTPQGRVFAFEPSKWFDVLQYNVLSNPAQNVELFQSGLGNEEGSAYVEVLLQQHPAGVVSNAGANRLVPSTNPGGNIQTQIITLDGWIRQHPLPRIDWIKIDTEGMEHQILQGGVHTIKSFKPKLFIELNEAALSRYDSSGSNLFSFIQSLGYSHFYKAGRRARLIPIDPNRIAGTVNQNVICSMQPLSF